MEVFDLVIVGAGKFNQVSEDRRSHNLRTGIHGLTVLKTYRDVHPGTSILVIEKGNSLGGVWAKERLYPGLHTNNHFRT